MVVETDRADDRNDTTSTKENVPFPELAELPVSGMSGVNLIAIMKMRQAMRVPLETLCVYRRDHDNIQIREEHWRLLKETVGKVEWVKVDTEDTVY